MLSNAHTDEGIIAGVVKLLQVENQVLQKILKGIFFPLFNCTTGTTYEVILKDSERCYAGYAKRTIYPV